MERILESIRDFVKKEDPFLWLSLFIASVISFLFFIFILYYVYIYYPL